MTTSYCELLIGCGNCRKKRMGKEGFAQWHDLTTLDINPDHNPDVLWDLEKYPYPFADNTFDEIHAYEVLEHLGRQGDWRAFFDQFTEFWRILKPDGCFFGTTPEPGTGGVWADPGHCREVSKGTLLYLQQRTYDNMLPGLPWTLISGEVTDYRFYYKVDFVILEAVYWETTFRFVLKALKEGSTP